MKKSLLVILTLLSFSALAVESEKVCIKDPKTNKETCKIIKKHKKLDGTKVPEKKK
jgi:hypothetical protein